MYNNIPVYTEEESNFDEAKSDLDEIALSLPESISINHGQPLGETELQAALFFLRRAKNLASVTTTIEAVTFSLAMLFYFHPSLPLSLEDNDAKINFPQSNLGLTITGVILCLNTALMLGALYTIRHYEAKRHEAINRPIASLATPSFLGRRRGPSEADIPLLESEIHENDPSIKNCTMV